jgi:23S rRNA (guanosine2251-2'-O)-methyltransferase
MAYGVQPILEAFKAGQPLDKIFMLRGLKTPESAEIAQLAADAQVPVLKVPVEKLNQFTRKNHQGIVAFMAAIAYQPLDAILSQVYEEGRMPFLLLLDGITDVRNFGAIARTAECVGVDAIVVPMKGAAPMGPDALKTSAGALNYVPVCREGSLLRTIKYLQEYGVQVVACTEKAADSVYAVDYTQPLAIVVGSEEDGISKEVLMQADRLAKIPMSGQVGSLNVSVAAGAIMFEAVRQRLAGQEG